MTHQLKMGSVRTPDRSHGFTIVELLIVIVVIGILAALVLSSVATAQRNARNAQTAHAVEAYKKGLMAYAVVNGTYPDFNYVCLGQNLTNNKCWYGNWPESAGLSAALKTTMGSTLPLAGIGGDATGPGYAGATGDRTVDGVHTAIIFYMIDTTGDPNIKCPVGPIISYLGDPNMSSANPAGRSTYGNNCWIALPDPSKL